MHRPRIGLCVVLAPILFILAFTVAGCGGGPEDSVLRSYFQAARARDNVTLGNIATVSLDAEKDGMVESFSVETVGAEQTMPLDFKALAKAADDAKAEDAAFTKKMREYQDANTESLNRILHNEKLKPADNPVKAEWDKMRAQSGEIQKKLSEARAKANPPEKNVAELSVFNAQRPVDVTALQGQLVSKDVTISANVRKQGQGVEKHQMVVTLQRATFKNADGSDLTGKWIVTKIHDQGGAGKVG